MKALRKNKKLGTYGEMMGQERYTCDVKEINWGGYFTGFDFAD